MNIEIEKIAGDIDDRAIDEFEASCGLSLPSEYRSFLLKYNVGCPKKNGFFYKHVEKIKRGDEPDGSISYFYGLSGNETWRLQWAYEIYVKNSRIPKEYLPIATDPGGNNLCIGVGEGNYGKIYFWDHEKEVYEDEDPFKLLANDFDSFINSLEY